VLIWPRSISLKKYLIKIRGGIIINHLDFSVVEGTSNKERRMRAREQKIMKKYQMPLARSRGK
jgi:hypothetical protein